MKKLFIGIAVLVVMVAAMALVGQADQTITITKPTIISGTTYTTGNVTVDDNTARLLVRDGKATYVSAPASQNKPTISTNTLSATTGNVTTVNATTVNATTVTATTANATTSTITGTLTTANLVVTAGTTTTCSGKISAVTIRSGIITAATCTS